MQIVASHSGHQSPSGDDDDRNWISHAKTNNGKFVTNFLFL